VNPATVSLAAVLALASPASAGTADASGEAAFEKCASCHSVEAGDTTPAGPTLSGVVGRPVASVPDFRYSPAMRAFGKQGKAWNPDLLDRFITDPQGVVRGTYMDFPGVKRAEERAQIISYLRRKTERSEP
jgi:cytochrome c